MPFKQARNRPKGWVRSLDELDLKLFKKVAVSRERWSGSWLRRLSHAANRSLLWMGTASVLALFGGQRGRRAALRGMSSIGVTSFVVNVPLKSATRRPRPGADLVPEIRRLKKIPTSTSFPSGHSASAFAFATGVAQEIPQLAVPLYGLAGAVAYSRVYTGVHYPGDVLVGSAIGAGAGVGTRMLWPMQLALPATAKAATETPGGKDGAGLSVVVNPGAGNRDDEAAEIKRLLARSEVVEMGPDDDLVERLERLARDADYIGASGGDGTIGCAADIALAHDKPLAVFPGGTLNHLAKALGLETLEDTVDAISEGNLVEIDAGRVDDQLFLNTASIGGYPEMVDFRERLEDRWGKWPSALVALIRTLHKQESFEVEIDGRRRRLWMLFAGNCSYGSDGFVSPHRDQLDDGLLDIRLINAEPKFSRTKVVLASLLGVLNRSDVYERFMTNSVKISSNDGTLRVACDGETHDIPGTFEISKDPKKLQVFASHATLR